MGGQCRVSRGSVFCRNLEIFTTQFLKMVQDFYTLDARGLLARQRRGTSDRVVLVGE